MPDPSKVATSQVTPVEEEAAPPLPDKPKAPSPTEVSPLPPAPKPPAPTPRTPGDIAEENLRLGRSIGLTPSSERRVDAVSRRTGQPPGLVREQPGIFQQEAPNARAITHLYPAVGALMARSPRHAAMVADDIEPLIEVERWRQAFDTIQRRSAFTPPVSLGEAFQYGQDAIANLGEAYWEREFLGETKQGKFIAETELKFRDWAQREQKTGTLKWMATSAIETLGLLTQTGKKAAPVAAVGAVAGGLAGGLPSGGVGAIPGAVVGAKLFGGTAALWHFYKVSAGHAANEIAQIKDVDGRPIPRDVYLPIASLIGGAEAGLEFIGMHGISKTIPTGWLKSKAGQMFLQRAVAHEATRESLKAVTQRFGHAVTQETLTEMAQEAANILGEYAAVHATEAMTDQSFSEEDRALLTAENFDRVFQAGKKALAASTVLSLPGTIFSGVSELNHRRRIQARRNVDNKVHEIIGQSKLAQENPELAKEFLQSTGFGGERYLDADRIADVPPDTLAKAGITQEQVEAARATGDPIPVRMEHLQTTANLDLEEFRVIREAIREHPGDLSPAEIQDSPMEEEVARATETLDELAGRERAIQEEVRRLRKDVAAAVQQSPKLRDQARLMGDSPNDVARTVVGVWESFANRMADDGIEAVELLRRISIVARPREQLATVPRSALVSASQEILEPLPEGGLGFKRAVRLKEGGLVAGFADPTRQTLLLERQEGGPMERVAVSDFDIGELTDEGRSQPGGIVIEAMQNEPVQIREEIAKQPAADQAELHLVAEAERVTQRESGIVDPQAVLNQVLQAIEVLKLRRRKGLRDSVRTRTLEQRARGSVEIKDDGFVINLFSGADLTTLLHEGAHVFLEEMKAAVESGIAGEGLTRDWQTIAKWLQHDGEQAITNQQHEQFAVGVEEYFREGNAPNSRLAEAFSRIRRWFLRIYRSIRDLGTDRVELTDEVRGAFDRLLATETDVFQEVNKGELHARLEKELTGLGLSREDKVKVQRQLEAAKSAILEILQRRRDKGRKTREKQWRKEAEKEIDSQPRYQVMQRVKELGGFRWARIMRDYGSDTVKALRSRGMINKRESEVGLQPEEVAVQFGYESVDSMIVDLLDADTSRRAAIESIVTDRSLDHAARFSAAEAMTEVEEYAQYMDLMSQFYHKALRPQENRVARSAYRRLAEDRIGTMPLRNATAVERFVQAFHSAHKRSRREAARGNFEGALEAMEQARLLFEQARVARETRKMLKDAIRIGNKAIRAKGTIDFDHQANLFALMDRMEMIRGRASVVTDGKKSLQTLIRDVAHDMVIADDGLFSDDILDESFAQDYQTLPVEKFREVSNLIRFLAGRGRDIVADETALADMKRSQLREVLMEPIRRLRDKPVHDEKSVIGRFTRMTRSLFASLDQFLFIARRLDGGTNFGPNGTMGPNERFVYGALEVADNNKMRMRRDMRVALSPHIQQLLKTISGGPKNITDVPTPPILAVRGRTWTMENVVAIALNMGNNYNRDAVMQSYGISEGEMNALVGRGRISDADWTAIQGVWDTIDTLWPQIRAVHLRVNHFVPERVQRTAFTTPTGRRLSGGYYPLIFDRKLAEQVAEWTEHDELMNRATNVIGNPNTRKGFTKARVGPGGLPPRLRMSVIGQHVEDTIQYITHEETIRELDRLMTRRESGGTNPYKTLVTQKLGEDVANRIRPFLRDVARSEREMLNEVENWLEHERGLMTVWGLGLNLGSAITNLTGITTVWSEIGMGRWLSGAAEIIKNPIRTISDINQASPYMAERAKLVDRDIRDLVNTQLSDQGQIRLIPGVEFNVPGVNMKAVQQFMFIHIFAGDAALNYPAWIGFYKNALKQNGGNTDAAIIAANEAVAASNPSARVMDLSEFQRSTKGLHRMFSMFQTWVIKYGNRQRGLFNAWRDGGISTYQYLRAQWLEAVLPPLLMQMGWAWMWGRDMEEDDLEDATFDVLTYQFQGIPFAGDIAAWAVQTPRGAWSPDPRKTPLLSGLDVFTRFEGSIVALAKDMEDEEKLEVAAWRFADLVGWRFGVPISKMAEKAVEGIRQMEEEGAAAGALLRPDPELRR